MLRENSNWNEMFKDLLKWSFKTSTCNYLAYITYPRQTWTCTWTQYTHTEYKPECNERILKWFDDDDWKANSPLSLSFFFTQSHTHTRGHTHLHRQSHSPEQNVLHKVCFSCSLRQMPQTLAPRRNLAIHQASLMTPKIWILQFLLPLNAVLTFNKYFSMSTKCFLLNCNSV